ncbi:BamA/TamA family outer membrane protein [Echinicola sp. CAU 1574]|uniref:BamA/TamA family outer membrane protein n=1 Tax=Echinicola arenosa TaxID=2774144 RepID=A0ABR9ANR7_9BACT|nr:BamA/TamA family outer membrane protein [Echinicola arenosa]MBD8489513.1 BamA/TamA family outer membrane protein [Echinicola arenosa]
MIFRYLIFSFIAFTLVACSGTKSLSEGEVLYTGSKIHINKKEYKEDWKIKNDEKKLVKVYWDLWDVPNGGMMGLPTMRFLSFRLWLYNLFYNEKEQGLAKWIRDNFGEEPILISDVKPDFKIQKAIEDYENFGHFGTTGRYDLHYNRKKNKAYIHYRLTVPKVYHYRKVMYDTSALEGNLKILFLNYQPKSVLHEREEFDLEKIRSEKTGLWNTIQNNGYYYLKKEDVLVMADTTVGYKQIDVKVGLNGELPDSHFKRQKINDLSVAIDTAQREVDGYYYWPYGKVKKHLLDKMIQVNEGEYFSLERTKHSMRNLADLGIFRNPSISYEVHENDSLALDANVDLIPKDASLLGFNVNGNYKTTGYIGPSISLKYNQLNLFGGAENLSVEANTYYDFPIGLYKDRVSNSSGFGIFTTLDAPLLDPPFKFIKNDFSLPKKYLSLDFEYNNRRDYFTLATWNAAYGFTWKSNSKVTHKLDLIKLTFSDVIRSSERFDTLINNDPSLQLSLSNQFILGSGYTYRFDNSSTENKRLGTYFEGKVELAGNILNLASGLVSGTEEGSRKFLGVKYSQYARFEYDFRAYWRVGQYSHLVFRNLAGLGLSYGNSTQMPFIKEFFIGGSNSLRPFNARNVGPGRYIELDEAEVNQVGDLKLEWNLEYRFKIFTKLNGALWSDAGNIWLLEEDPNRPFSGVRWGKLFQDSYLTSGVGLRIDLKYLLLRLDYGAVLYAPIFIDGYKWIWENKLPLHGPVIGFGYPF